MISSVALQVGKNNDNFRVIMLVNTVGVSWCSALLKSVEWASILPIAWLSCLWSQRGHRALLIWGESFQYIPFSFCFSSCGAQICLILHKRLPRTWSAAGYSLDFNFFLWWIDFFFFLKPKFRKRCLKCLVFFQMVNLASFHFPVVSETQFDSSCCFL